jgi:hypothetical protein
MKQTQEQALANTRWRRQRLSALVVSRLFRFVGGLVQSSGFANPALRLSYSVSAERFAPALTGRRLQASACQPTARKARLRLTSGWSRPVQRSVRKRPALWRLIRRPVRRGYEGCGGITNRVIEER